MFKSNNDQVNCMKMGKMPKTPKSDQQQTAIKKGRSARPFIMLFCDPIPDHSQYHLTLVVQLAKAAI